MSHLFDPILQFDKIALKSNALQCMWPIKEGAKTGAFTRSAPSNAVNVNV